MRKTSTSNQKNGKLKINIQVKKTSKFNRLILLYVNFGYKSVLKYTEEHITENNPEMDLEIVGGYIYDSIKENLKQTTYKPLVISTGLSVPIQFWDDKEKKCLGVYDFYNDKLFQIIEGIELLYKTLCNIPNKIVTPEIFHHHIQKDILQVLKKKTD